MKNVFTGYDSSFDKSSSQHPWPSILIFFGWIGSIRCQKSKYLYLLRNKESLWICYGFSCWHSLITSCVYTTQTSQNFLPFRELPKIECNFTRNLIYFDADSNRINSWSLWILLWSILWNLFLKLRIIREFIGSFFHFQLNIERNVLHSFNSWLSFSSASVYFNVFSISLCEICTWIFPWIQNNR